MDPTIFISHSSKDKDSATAICEALEARGLSCWIAHRDVGPQHFGEAIVRAIRAARVMVLVFTGHANRSDEIKKELVLASQCRLTVIPVRLEDVAPEDAFAYEFATRQWIDLFPDRERSLDRLTAWIQGVLPSPLRAEPPEPSPPPPSTESVAASPSRIVEAPSAVSPAPAARSRPETAKPQARPRSPIPGIVAAVLVILTIGQMIDIGLNQTGPETERYPSEFLLQGAAWSALIVLAGACLLVRPRLARTLMLWLSAIGLAWELYLMALAARSPQPWQAHLNVYLAYPAVFALCLVLLLVDRWRRARAA